MGIADWVRIIRGNLTPGEIAERDALAAARVERKRRAAEAASQRGETWTLYQERARRAGGISHVNVICHQDTWRFIESYASTRTAWRSPGPDRTTKHPDDMVELHLSGMQVALILNVMAEVSGVDRRGAGALGIPYVNRSIAARLYDAFGAVVDQADTAAPGGPLPPVVIDDRAATPLPPPEPVT